MSDTVLVYVFSWLIILSICGLSELRSLERRIEKLEERVSPKVKEDSK